MSVSHESSGTGSELCSPAQTFAAAVHPAIAAERVQSERTLFSRECRFHPAYGLAARHVEARCREVDHVNAVVLGESEFVGVPVDHGFDFRNGLDGLKQTRAIQQVDPGPVMEEEDRGSVVGRVQEGP